MSLELFVQLLAMPHDQRLNNLNGSLLTLAFFHQPLVRFRIRRVDGDTPAERLRRADCLAQAQAKESVPSK